MDPLWLVLGAALAGLGPAALIRRGTRRQLRGLAAAVGLDGPIGAHQGWLEIQDRFAGRDVWLRLHSGGGVRLGLDLEAPELLRVALRPRTEPGGWAPFPDPVFSRHYAVDGPEGPILALLTADLRTALVAVATTGDDAEARPGARLDAATLFLEFPARHASATAARDALARLLPAVPAGAFEVLAGVRARLEDDDELESVRLAALGWLLERPDEEIRAQARAYAEGSGVPRLAQAAAHPEGAADAVGRLSLAEESEVGRLSETEGDDAAP